MNWFSLLLILLLLPGVAQAEPARSRSVQEIMAALDKYPVNEVKRDTAQKILDAPLPEGASNLELANIHWQRGRAAQELGLANTRITELRTTISLGGGSNPSRVWKEMCRAEHDGGNIRLAIEACKKAISITPQNKQGQLPGDHA